MTSIVIRRGEEIQRRRHTGRVPCENRGRDMSDASISQGMPRNAKDCQQYQKLREMHGTDSPLKPSESVALPTSQNLGFFQISWKSLAF